MGTIYLDEHGRKVFVDKGPVSGYMAYAKHGYSQRRGYGCFAGTRMDAQAFLDLEARKKGWTMEGASDGGPGTANQ